MLTEKGSSVFIGSPVRLIPRSVSHHRPGVRDDQPFQYDTNGCFSIENESLLLCSLAVISLRITWEPQVQQHLWSPFPPFGVVQRGDSRLHWSLLFAKIFPAVLFDAYAG